MSDASPATDNLWPTPIFCGALETNASRASSGTTSSGTNWSYTENNSHDCEDNDTSYNFVLGHLRVNRQDNCGRDCASDTSMVQWNGELAWQKGDFRSRDPTQNQDKEPVEPLQKALGAAAEIEGVSWEQLRDAIPIRLV